MSYRIARRLRAIDRYLDGRHRFATVTVALCCLLIVGAVDYATGYEVSVSVFYLAPIGLAAWYAGRQTGIAFALICCVAWYFADFSVGHHYSNPIIPFWNALVRLGFFLIIALLLASLRSTLRAQQHLARTDPLTGLYGRREFDARLEHDMALARRRKSALTLAYVDVDNFKAVNDKHGHASGDRVLREAAAVLKNSLRESDTAARLGGDEFALILPDTGAREAQDIVSRITDSLREMPTANGWRITCSVGAVTFEDITTSPDRALAAADELMYGVKRRGKGAVAFNVVGRTVQAGADDTL